MPYMLDTNLCIALIRGSAGPALHRLTRLRVDEAGISTITLSELIYGAAKSKRPGATLAEVHSLCAPLFIASFDAAAAAASGQARADLERVGTPIGPKDLLIAGHALSLGAVVLTANIREFSRVPGLVVENWLTQA